MPHQPPKQPNNTVTCMLCSLNVAPFLQRWVRQASTQIYFLFLFFYFIVAALITPSHKLVCGVAFGLRGAEVLIVCTIIDGLPCSAHVLRYAERKFNMKLHADQAEAAGQV